MAGNDLIKTYTVNPSSSTEDTKPVTGTDIGNKRGLDTYIQGGNVAASSAGAANGKTSSVSIDETAWFLLPAVPEGTRKGLSIQNYSGSPILINFSNTALATLGVTIENTGDRFYNIQAAIYARRKTGVGAITIIVEELY